MFQQQADDCKFGMNNLSEQGTPKLMVSGSIATDAMRSAFVTVWRGMPILARDGREVGKLAAVALTDGSEAVTYLLLGRLPDREGYWLVSLDLIMQADEEKIQLAILAEAAEELPRWHSG
jgi:hypothetical protein